MVLCIYFEKKWINKIIFNMLNFYLINLFLIMKFSFLPKQKRKKKNHQIFNLFEKSRISKGLVLRGGSLKTIHIHNFDVGLSYQRGLGYVNNTPPRLL